MSLVGGKRCSGCEERKPNAEFNKNRAQRDGLDNWCRACQKRKASDPEFRARLRAKWNSLPSDHPQKVAASEANRARYVAEPERFKKSKRAHRLRRYGLTEEQFEEMFEEQGGRCAICDTQDFGGIRPHIDHCHETQVVRGLLCARCNVGLGQFLDDIGRLRKAILYLERSLSKARAA